MFFKSGEIRLFFIFTYEAKMWMNFYSICLNDYVNVTSGKTNKTKVIFRNIFVTAAKCNKLFIHNNLLIIFDLSLWVISIWCKV